MSVLDASVGLKWFVDEVDSEKAIRLREEYRAHEGGECILREDRASLPWADISGFTLFGYTDLKSHWPSGMAWIALGQRMRGDTS